MATATQVVQTQGNSGTEDWKSSLPEDLRGDASLRDIKDLPGLAKSFVNAQKMIGNSLRMPAPEAEQKDWDSFYSKMGRPDKPEAYSLTKPSLPDNMEYDEDFEKMLRSSGHAAGLNSRQLQRIVEDYAKFATGRIVESDKQMGAEKDAAVSMLKQEWGGSYDRNLGLALSAIEKFGGKELKQELNDAGIGNNPLLVRAFAAIGEKLLEDGHVTGNSVSMQDEKTSLEKEKSDLYEYFKTNKVQGREYANKQERLTSINRRLIEIDGE